MELLKGKLSILVYTFVIMDGLTEETKESMQNAYLHKAEAQLQEEIATKKKYAKTSKDFYEALTLELARPACNKCGAIIKLYEMPKFSRNGGYCENCK